MNRWNKRLRLAVIASQQQVSRTPCVHDTMAVCRWVRFFKRCSAGLTGCFRFILHLITERSACVPGLFSVYTPSHYTEEEWDSCRKKRKAVNVYATRIIRTDRCRKRASSSSRLYTKNIVVSEFSQVQKFWSHQNRTFVPTDDMAFCIYTS